MGSFLNRCVHISSIGQINATKIKTKQQLESAFRQIDWPIEIFNHLELTTHIKSHDTHLLTKISPE